MSKYTASGARRSGDDYQDLQSAEVLVGWLEQRDRFRWVRLEAMDGSLDDIQAEEADGKQILRQVKFGVDPAHEWTWDELTKREASAKRKRGIEEPPAKPSLIMKWASSLARIQARFEVRDAGLVTNRSCSLELRASLGSDGRLDFRTLADTTKATIVGQLGSEDEAIAFFGNFQFRFGDPGPDALAEGLFSRFARLGGTREGWYRLIDAVKRWINRQDEPHPDGHILLADVKAAANWHRPPAVPESFLIPSDFVPPERWGKHDVEPSILGEARSNVVVITGSPGIGKSTYVSWLVDRLTEQEVPVVRHHFFLSLTDATMRRSAWDTAADAIIGQLLAEHPDLVADVDGRNPTPDRLREFLEAAASASTPGKPLVAVIDGLDHVWRETGTSDDLNRLFDMLLPMPDGMVLVVGTQSIDAGRLPAKLRQHAPREGWHEVPVLDNERVHAWLQHHTTDLELPDQADHAVQVVADVADALHKVSSGHPLVLHYVYEAERQRGLPVLARNVLRAPVFDPASGMKGYYENLWDQLTPLGRSLLHVLAGFSWAWPDEGLVQCFTADADAVKLDEAEREVRHLLGRSDAGITAFHESLLAFVRRAPDHERAVTSRRGAVLSWLEAGAPPFWRWRYAWTERAHSGDDEPLIVGPTLDWCVDALVSGRGTHDVVSIVAESGRRALGKARLGQATERHLIDAYVENATHADDVLAGLRWVALHLVDPAERDEQLRLLLASKGQLSEKECGAVAEVAFATGHRSVCKQLLSECADRWDTAIRRADRGGDPFLELAAVLPMLLGAALDDPGSSSYRRAVAEDGAAPPYCKTAAYARALRALCERGTDTRSVREELRFIAARSGRPGALASDEVVRLACAEDFDPRGWLSGDPAEHGTLFRAFLAIVKRDPHVLTTPCPATSFKAAWSKPYGVDEQTFVDLARSHFFGSLGVRAEPVDVPHKANEVRRFLVLLADVASDAAALADKATLDGAWFLEHLGRRTPPDIRPNDHDNSLVGRALVAQVVVAIALDLETLGQAMGLAPSLTREVLSAAVDGRWTWERSWIEGIVMGHRPLRDAGAAHALQSRERDRLRDTRDTPSTRAEHYITLAKFAHFHKRPRSEVRELAVLAARNLMGHGYHKDTILFDVIEAVRHVHPWDVSRTAPRLARVTPLSQCISDITDGDHTSHLPREIGRVLGEVLPDHRPSWIRMLQRGGSHWNVEQCLTDVATGIPLHTEQERAIGSTLVHEEALVALQKRGLSGDASAGAVLQRTLLYMGRAEPPTGDRHDESRSDFLDRESKSLPDVVDYPPESLDAFIAAVRDASVFGDEPIAAWTDYWRTRAPTRLLNTLAAYHQSHGYVHERLSGKIVVRLASEHEGSEAAWRWLVVYHNAVHGWSSYGDHLSEAEWIWATVARRFPERWAEFIIATTSSEWASTSAAPTWSAERMARYLTALGQVQQAQDVVDAAVRWSSGLAANMSLPDPGVLNEYPEVPPNLQLLVDRLDCPSRLVQERAASAIATLLATSASPEVAAALLTWHAAEPLELRSCVFLLILLGAQRHHGMPRDACVAVARAAKLVGSVAANELFQELAGVEESFQSSPAADRPHPPPVVAFDLDFDRTVRAHLAPLFLDWASGLDELTLTFSGEWRGEAAKRAHQQGLSLKRNMDREFHYRSSSKEGSLPISDRLSVMLRSSFLRTLDQMRADGRLDNHAARVMARRVGILIEPSMWGVGPQSRPEWWPSDPGDIGRMDVLAQEVHTSVQARLADEGVAVLAYAAGPVGNRKNLQANLEVRGFLQASYGSLRPLDRELAAVPRVKCEPLGGPLGMAGPYRPVTREAGLVRGWLLAPLAWRIDGDCLDWLVPDRETRGLHVPAGWLASALAITPHADGVTTVAGDAVVGNYRYWNDELRERTFYGAVPRLGVELDVQRAHVQRELDRGATLCWVATLTVSQRGDYDERFSASAVVGTWVIGGSRFVFPQPWSPPD